MKLSTHLGFNGNCDEAMKFYATTFGGTINFTMTWAESPMCDQVGPEFQDKIMHQSLTVGGTLLMGADAPPGRFQTAQGIVVSIAVDTPEDADRVFAALSEGGNITMPIQETFWARRFGMCTDRFGIPWMVNCEKPMTA
jgi:PhnB protein